MENVLEQLIIDDEMALLDEEDMSILLEEETERIPADLKERILQGEYIL